jgi:hypothetical protein
MDSQYVVETSPSHNPTDSQSNDAIRTARYMYDLELGENGEILGGEWYRNEHPDFLWTPGVGVLSFSVGDSQLRRDYDGYNPVSSEYPRAAQIASSRGQPLAKVVRALIAVSRAGI